ncbi:MAG: hypothetical protein M0Z77_08455 [Thermoplasmatales archaeon]|jgi:hypothetical protein|nr:hypothetical protein [Candidatus Thermoplasmatota archaeon]MCL6002560.1 hypothetical protein [Candidatus Thermoplasmatota archaeon]MDA8055658.1 hypothetical protein [Thermoplasmatales archaeon]
MTRIKDESGEYGNANFEAFYDAEGNIGLRIEEGEILSSEEAKVVALMAISQSIDKLTEAMKGRE